ncbi:hypothetical protein LCGC14_0567040 [marine sediment metagenome]|uniref:Glycine zipper domain-containing protein n=1 Tax=marine sediment metagenome TaxID=412755 RepID=A0A0F9S3Z5_9ZZZZ
MSFGKFDPRTLGLTSTRFKEDFGLSGMFEVAKELAKVKPESWRNFKEGIQGLGAISGSPIAAARAGIQAPFSQISTQVGFGFQSAIQPFTNQLSGLVNQLSNATQPFLQRNIIGAGIGATVGAILGSFLPGPGTTVGAILGGFVGAGIQSLLTPGGGGGGGDFPIGAQPPGGIGLTGIPRSDFITRIPMADIAADPNIGAVGNFSAQFNFTAINMSRLLRGR